MVLIRHVGGAWHEPSSSAFSNEKELQDLVKLSPTLLPGGDPLAVVDELSIPGVGYVDLVGVGADGQLVIVECKLKANPEIRREVIGQVLAYAGGIWRMSYEEFRAAFEHRAGTSLYSAVQSATSTQLEEPALVAAITANLEAGAFRLVVAVDQITPELRTIIEFVNSHTIETVQVQALELDYSRDGDVELLDPVVYGVETVTKKKSGTAGTKWTQQTFSEQIADKCSGPDQEWLQRLIAHADAHGQAVYGSGITPGMSGHYPIAGTTVSLWSIYLYDSGPKVALNIGTLAEKVSEQAAIQWLTQLNTEPALAQVLAGISASNLNKYPGIPASTFGGPVGDHLLATIDAQLA